MIVRDATPDDIPALARVAVEAYRFAFATILEPEALAAYDTAFFENRFAAEWPQTRVAGSPVAGFAKTTGSHLDLLFVAPTRHGEGIGTALLDDSTARGITSLECFRDNAAARRFYERHGWRVTESYARQHRGRTRDFVLYGKP